MDALHLTLVVTASDEMMLPDEILPGLYLGSWDSAVNKHLLKHLGVTHILTVASQLTPAFPEAFLHSILRLIRHR